MSFQHKVRDPEAFVWLYGTTPPRAGASDEQVDTAATRLAARLRTLALDGVLVYDVQDEASRTSLPRPFPFLPTIDPRVYARLLRSLADLPTIPYKCVAPLTEAAWATWLDETHAVYHDAYISLVGRSSSAGSPGGLTLTQAVERAVSHEAGFTVGGVVIPERHSAARSESRRVVQKTEAGCRYFVSQAVYDAEASVGFLADYARDCRELGLPPQRIVLTFVPCGREKTMQFLKWLGVSISDQTQQAILSAAAPLTRSIQLCCANLRAILEQPFVQSVPLGVNVESVSIYKGEIDASLELFHALQDVVASYRS